MTYETKNITFHAIRVKVSSKSRCSRTLPMNVAIESAHYGCERNLCKDWAWTSKHITVLKLNRLLHHLLFHLT